MNVELLFDLMEYMKVILAYADLPIQTALQTLICASKLRTGLGMAVNIDFSEYYNQLYEYIPKALVTYDEKNCRLLIDAIYLMLIKAEKV